MPYGSVRAQQQDPPNVKAKNMRQSGKVKGVLGGWARFDKAGIAIKPKTATKNLWWGVNPLVVSKGGHPCNT